MSYNQISKDLFKKGLAAGVVSLALVGVCTVVGKDTDYAVAPLVDGATAPKDAAASGLEFTAGTYSATAKGLLSDVTVTMTFTDNMITKVSVDADGETPELGGAASLPMAEQIAAAQSATVDCISGSTITSTAIKAAAYECISQASGIPVEELKPEELNYVPGKYASTAKAGLSDIEDGVTVVMTFDEKNIVDVSIESSNAGEYQEQIDAFTAAIMEKQSENIEAISGATITQQAVQMAVAECIRKAYAGEDPMVEEAVEVPTGYTPGTYTASAAGIMGDVTVTMTMDDTSITDVQIDASCETPELGGAAAESLAAAILEKQSADVDAVSGSTITSDAVKAAAADCIGQAAIMGEGGAAGGVVSASAAGLMGDVTVTMTVENGVIADVQIDASSETPELGGAAAETLAAAILESQSVDVDSVAGATITSEAVKTAAADCLEQAANMGDGGAAGGVVTASAPGLMGDVTVTMTLDNGVIADVQIDASSETPELGGAAAETLAAAILEKQSVDVDSVAGATITSEAVKTAAAECLTQAGVEEPTLGELLDEAVEVVEDAIVSVAEDTKDLVDELTTEAMDAVEEIAAGIFEGAGESYSASAAGLMGDVTVTMTVTEGTIANVEIDASSETPDLGGAAAETLAAAILESQSVEVDSVAGATITSKAVIAAATDVLVQAGLIEEVDDGIVEEEESEMESESESESEVAAAGDGVSASAAGLMGDVTVTMVIEDGVIVDVQIDASSETPELGGAAAETLAAAILEKQSADVDSVAGATVTSEAVKAAAAECLAK